jgi:hypothetical protein
MKKMIASILLLGIGISTLSLTACGHDDSLIGTWQATSTTNQLSVFTSGRASAPQSLPRSGAGSIKMIFSADKFIMKTEGAPEVISDVKYLKGTSDKTGTTYKLVGSGFGQNGVTAVVDPNGDKAIIDLGVASMTLKRE